MRRSGIYRIELGNGYFYIGSAVHLDGREKKHRSDLRCSVHINKRMQNCWNKYGVFEFVVLEECKTQVLLLQEQTWIDIHFANPKNVNINPTAGSSLGYKHSVEARAKMSTAKIGHLHSAERRAKNSVAQKGKVRSAETCAKISAIHKGKVFSIEHRAKISDANRRRGAKFRMGQLAMEEMEYGKKCS